jgi:hypothetical protein
VVFPLTKELPESAMPLLDGQRTLGEALRAACASHPVGQWEYATLLELAQQQILQLDLRRWLVVEGIAAEHRGPASWPAPLVAAVAAAAPRAELRVDPLGTSLSIEVRGPRSTVGVVLVPDRIADPKYAWRRAASTALSYRGNVTVLTPLLRAVLAALERWDRDEPGGMEAWWAREAPRLAGEKLRAATPPGER